MAAGSTYTPIATYTASGSPTQIDFTSISSAYTDLVIVVSAAGSSGNDLYFRFNDDSNNNYSYTILYGTGSAAGSTRVSNNSKGICDYYGALGTTLGESNQIIQVMNYANTTTYKTVLVRSNKASNGTDAVVNLWRSTSAVNKITFGYLAAGAYSFVTGSTITLYGITAA